MANTDTSAGPSINLDDLQTCAEKLVQLLKEREEEGAMWWKMFFHERLQEIHALVGPLVTPPGKRFSTYACHVRAGDVLICTDGIAREVTLAAQSKSGSVIRVQVVGRSTTYDFGEYDSVLIYTSRI